MTDLPAKTAKFTSLKNLYVCSTSQIRHAWFKSLMFSLLHATKNLMANFQSIHIRKCIHTIHTYVCMSVLLITSGHQTFLVINKIEYFSLKVGVSCGSNSFNRRLAYVVTVIILASKYFKRFITKALEYKVV